MLEDEQYYPPQSVGRGRQWFEHLVTYPPGQVAIRKLQDVVWTIENTFKFLNQRNEQERMDMANTAAKDVSRNVTSTEMWQRPPKPNSPEGGTVSSTSRRTSTTVPSAARCQPFMSTEVSSYVRTQPIRPLSWVLFLPTLCFFRLCFVGVNLARSVLQREAINYAQIITKLQAFNRHLRAIRKCGWQNGHVRRFKRSKFGFFNGMAHDISVRLFNLSPELNNDRWSRRNLTRRTASKIDMTVDLVDALNEKYSDHDDPNDATFCPSEDSQFSQSSSDEDTEDNEPNVVDRSSKAAGSPTDSFAPESRISRGPVVHMDSSQQTVLQLQQKERTANRRGSDASNEHESSTSSGVQSGDMDCSIMEPLA